MSVYQLMNNDIEWDLVGAGKGIYHRGQCGTKRSVDNWQRLLTKTFHGLSKEGLEAPLSNRGTFFKMLYLSLVVP